ncbi:MAG: O-antigen ligase family protein [Deltaproteobacteria bacterium]|nr:O-antigen ligase family protein [Deltaproteobacteria bacterium]
MFQNFWLKYEERLYALIPPLALIYIFFQPFNHFAGIRNIAFYGMLLFFVIKIARRGAGVVFHEINGKDSAIVALFLLLGAILISIVFSDYKIDSLNAFRKNFLCQFVVFFIILTEFRNLKKLKSLLYAVVLSFITVTLIILIKNPPAALFNILEAKANKETFLGGYALNAAFYMPFTLGYLLSSRDKLAIKGFFWSMLLAEFALVWLYYSSRTTLIAVLLSVIFMIVMSKRYEMLAMILAVVLGVGLVTYFKKPELFERHKTLFSFQTYTSNVGLSGRGYIWRGTVDMIKVSPVVGHGYGWKKIATVAREDGYLERWKEKWPETYDYFEKAGYGRANPHNLALQMLFEVGIVGLAAFILFWVTVFIKIVKIIRQGADDELNCFVKYGVVGVLVAYAIINTANGLWEETYGVLTFMLAAITLVVYEYNRCNDY